MRIAILTTDSRDHFGQYDRNDPYFGTAPEALLEGFKGMEAVEVHVLSCLHRPMVSPPKLADNIHYHGLAVSSIGWLKTGYQGCIRAVRRKLREIQPDIVHGQGTERDCAISAVLSGFPNVLTLHGNMRLVAALNRARPLSFEWLAARLEGWTLPRADGVVCITSYTQQAVAGLARKTWIVPNAVDPSFFEIEPGADAGERPLILCVGNICPRKNQNALIRALDGAEPDFDLVFLGGVGRQDPYGREFLNLIETRPWCRYEGFANRVVLKEWFSRASGVVLPSLEDNCPMVVLEAMAAGVPVAAASVGGVPDLIENDLTGILFDPLDAASMARGVMALFAEHSHAMAARACAQARLRYHPRGVADRHVSIYREVLQSGPSFA
ncbi:MAG: glycosyltransferase family 4 protein [Candidatus Methylacidiphilales bacterium]|nr:glycosyltransferase family 4 protein [Candidatus Methylacidiphilales bacterium]